MTKENPNKWFYRIIFIKITYLMLTIQVLKIIPSIPELVSVMLLGGWITIGVLIIFHSCSYYVQLLGGLWKNQ